MRAVLEDVLRVAPSRASVLVTGESGTGKELIAAAIHRHSTRAEGPFVKLHCSALAETLLESELFGHERGSFTGAVSRRDGRFKQADGGTLFLDEVGEISPSVQIKLLRFLQEHEFRAGWAGRTIKVDVRIVAATTGTSCGAWGGLFREDLYYRLNVFSLRPAAAGAPLGHPLAGHALPGAARRKRTRRPSRGSRPRPWPCSPVTPGRGTCASWRMRSSARWWWPAGTPSPPGTSRPGWPRHPPPEATSPGFPGPAWPSSSAGRSRTLELTGGSTSRAAEILGISVRTIQYRLREYAEKAGRVDTDS
jgi:two-component system NtrC family response regulator/two-component system response regulator HydG